MAIDPDAPLASCDFTQHKAVGLSAAERTEKQLECSVSLSDDGYTLTLECDGDISEISYGYDPHAEADRQFTCGGNICLAGKITGYDGELALFMPVQDIYRS